MSLPDRSIDPRLLTAAKDEFLKKGFDKASPVTSRSAGMSMSLPIWLQVLVLSRL